MKQLKDLTTVLLLNKNKVQSLMVNLPKYYFSVKTTNKVFNKKIQ